MFTIEIEDGREAPWKPITQINAKNPNNHIINQISKNLPKPKNHNNPIEAKQSHTIIKTLWNHNKVKLPQKKLEQSQK